MATTGYVNITYPASIKNIIHKRRINGHRLFIEASFLRQRQNVPKLFIVVDVATETKSIRKEKSTSELVPTKNLFTRALNPVAEAQNREVFIFYSTKLQMSYFIEVLKLHQTELNAIHNVIYKDICQNRFFYPLIKRMVDVSTTISMVSQPEGSNPIDKLFKAKIVPIRLPSNFPVDVKKGISKDNFSTDILLDSVPDPENTKITVPVYYKLERLWQRIISDSVFPLLKIYERLETVSKKLCLLRTILSTRHFVGTKLHMNALEQSRSLLGVLHKLLTDFHDHVIKLYIHMTRKNSIYRFVNIEQIILTSSDKLNLSHVLEGPTGPNSNEYFNYISSILFCIQLHPEWSVKGTLVNSILQVLQYDTYLRSKEIPNEQPVAFERYQYETIQRGKRDLSETSNGTKEEFYKYIAQTTLNSKLSISIFNSITDFEVWITDFSKKLHMPDFDNVEFQQELPNTKTDSSSKDGEKDPIKSSTKTGNMKLFPEYHIFEPRPREDYQFLQNTSSFNNNHDNRKKIEKTELENSPGYFKLLQLQEKLLYPKDPGLEPLMTNIVMVKLFPAPDVVANTKLIDEIYNQYEGEFNKMSDRLGISQGGIAPEVILTPIADLKNVTKFYGKNSYSQEGSTLKGFVSKYLPKRIFYSVYERDNNYLTSEHDGHSSILRYMYPKSSKSKSVPGLGDDRISNTEKRGGILSSFKYFIKETNKSIQNFYEEYTKKPSATTINILSEIRDYNYYSKTIQSIGKGGVNDHPVLVKKIVAGESYDHDIWLAYLLPVPAKTTTLGKDSGGDYRVSETEAVQFEVEKILGDFTIGRVYTDQFEKDVEYFKARLGVLIDYIPWTLSLATVDFIRLNVNTPRLAGLAIWYSYMGTLTVLSLGTTVGAVFMIAFAVRWWTNNTRGINSIWWLTMLIRVSSEMMLNVACMQSIRVGCDYAIKNVLGYFGIPSLTITTLRALANGAIRDFSIGLYEDWIRYRIALSLARSFILVTVRLIKYALVKILSVFNPVEFILKIMFPGEKNVRKRNVIMKTFGDLLKYIYDVLIDMSERGLSILIGGMMNAGLGMWSEMFPSNDASDEEQKEEGKKHSGDDSPESKGSRNRNQAPASTPTHTADSHFTSYAVSPRTTGCVGFTTAVEMTPNEKVQKDLSEFCVKNPSAYYEELVNNIRPNTEFFIKLHNENIPPKDRYLPLDKTSVKNLRDTDVINDKMDNFDIIWRYKNKMETEEGPMDKEGTPNDYLQTQVCVPTIACLLNTTLCGGQNTTGVNGRDSINNFTRNIPKGESEHKKSKDGYKENSEVQFPEGTTFMGVAKPIIKVAGYATLTLASVAGFAYAFPCIAPVFAAAFAEKVMIAAGTAAFNSASLATGYVAIYGTVAAAPTVLIKTGVAEGVLNSIGNNVPIPFSLQFSRNSSPPSSESPIPIKTSPEMNAYCGVNSTIEFYEKIKRAPKEQKPSTSTSSSSSSSSSSTSPSRDPAENPKTTTGFWYWLFHNPGSFDNSFFTNSERFDPQYVEAFAQTFSPQARFGLY